MLVSSACSRGHALRLYVVPNKTRPAQETTEETYQYCLYYYTADSPDIGLGNNYDQPAAPPPSQHRIILHMKEYDRIENVSVTDENCTVLTWRAAGRSCCRGQLLANQQLYIVLNSRLPKDTATACPSLPCGGLSRGAFGFHQRLLGFR
jgi:hypothetical protein